MQIVYSLRAIQCFLRGMSAWNYGDPLTRLLIETKSTSRKGLVVRHPSATSTNFIDLQVGVSTVASVDGAGSLTCSAITATSTVTLAADPTIALHAATKQYVDTSRMYSTEQYASTASYNYFGFTTVDGLWKVNRFDVTTGAKTTAQDSNNGPGTYADLTAAWVDYLTLVYA